MKRHLFRSISFLCLIAAFSLTSCSKIEDTPDNTPEIQQPAAITFTATLAPKGEGSQTKAITTGDKDGKEILNVAWVKDEQIAIFYEKTNDAKAKALATVTAVDAATGVATISASLTEAKDGGTAKFIYPYSLATKDGELNTGDGSAFRTQDGTIEYISRYLDAATGDGIIAVTGGAATVSGTVTMQNQVCICKFNFSGLSPDVTENYYDIIIKEKEGSKTNHTYTTAPIGITKASMGAVYMALLGTNDTNGKDFKFSVQGNKKSSSTADPEQKNYYETSSTNVKLEAGKFYRSIPVTVNINPISGNKFSTVTIPNDGRTYTLYGTTIVVTSGPAILCEGDATILLSGTNSVTTSADRQAAIFIPAGKTLTIQGSGSLTAESSGGAGIGGGHHGACGNIIIESGTIVAQGEDNAAGIGSGEEGTCGDITISGGTVNAMGGNDAAGIGGGHYGACGDITICGGIVIATGGFNAAGIGSAGEGICGDITISGGTITATGGTWAAGIGSGNRKESKYGTISIGKGITSVTATSGGPEAAPIGKGAVDQGSGTVTIDGKDTNTWTAGEDTDHLHWTVSNDGKTWTLTKKPESNQQ